MSQPTHEIERLEAPSREEFEERFVNQRKPVILTGVADRWKAYADWTPDYLKRVAGDSEVTVHFDENANFRDWYTTHWKKRDDKRLPLGELVDLLQAEPPERRYYMTEHSLHLISDALMEDLSMSDYISDRLVPGVSSGPCMFLGRDTCMPMHYHATTQAFMCQLQGSKKITLHGPDQWRLLYPRKWYQDSFVFSMIDGRTQRAIAEHDNDSVDYSTYPRLRKSRPLQFTVEPGEVLFIPVHWWHLTSAKGYQVSMTYFWQSKTAPFHYPSPGLQVHAHDMLSNAKKKVGRLTERLLRRRGGAAQVNGRG